MIPDEDHIARYCQPSRIDKGQIQASNFMLKPNHEALSVNWLEFLGGNSREEKKSALQLTYKTVFNRVSSGAKIALLNVGNVRQTVFENTIDNRELIIRHNPDTNNPSHSGIYNLKHDDMLIAELMREMILEVWDAR